VGLLALAVVWLATANLCLAVPTAPVAAGVAKAPAAPKFYVSLGDSYAAGYQPIASALHGKDTSGFAYQVVHLARQRSDDIVLRNFGCDGATTSTVIRQRGCELTPPGPDTAAYPTQTQANAAERFVEGHRDRIGLITVSLSGNDILGCTAAAILDSCVTAALPGIRANLATLLTGLRQVAGPNVPIIGLTYPDVLLGLYLSKDPAQRALAVDSVSAFQDLLNPALRAAYGAIGGSFIDVTSATGGYVPLVQATTSARYGNIPVAVADVCTFTYYCSDQDVHPTVSGYRVIARLIVGVLPMHHAAHH
jgi:lysophospholipase L1-like esterase